MKLNPEKCYVSHVIKKKIPLIFDYSLHNHILQPVKNGKYLGVTISNDLDWGPHIHGVYSKRNISDQSAFYGMFQIGKRYISVKKEKLNAMLIEK